MTESCRRVCSLCCDTSPRGQTSHPHAGHAKSSSLSARATSNVDDDDIDNRLLSSSLTCSTLPAHLYHFMMVWLVADNCGTSDSQRPAAVVSGGSQGPVAGV